MSGLPLILSLIDRQAYNPAYYGHDYGLGLHPHCIHHQPPHLRNHEPAANLSLVLCLPLEKKGSKCALIAQFKPNELTVKLLDSFIVVEGKHEEREGDHGYFMRHFVRLFTLPMDNDSVKVVSTLLGCHTTTDPSHLNVKENISEKCGDTNGPNGRSADKIKSNLIKPA